MGEKNLSPQLLSDWVSSAAFVFQGQVIALGESNLDGVLPNNQMATVHVEKVVIAPRELGDLTGKTVTVYLQSSDKLTKGQQMTFFATSWHYGKNIGVVEIGRTGLTAAEVRRDTINEVLKQLDKELEDRLRNAKIIVSGSVSSTYRSELKEGLPGIEEGVEWHHAQIRIETIEKGHPTADLGILFPMGGDREFGPIPKYSSGQKGVWLLRPLPSDEKQSSGLRDSEKNGENLIAGDPLDFHAISALPRIQALLWRMNE